MRICFVLSQKSNTSPAKLNISHTFDGWNTERSPPVLQKMGDWGFEAVLIVALNKQLVLSEKSQISELSEIVLRIWKYPTTKMWNPVFLGTLITLPEVNGSWKCWVSLQSRLLSVPSSRAALTSQCCWQQWPNLKKMFQCLGWNLVMACWDFSLELSPLGQC